MNSYYPNHGEADDVTVAFVMFAFVFLIAGSWYGRSALRLGFGRSFLFGLGTTLAATFTILVATDGGRHLAWTPHSVEPIDRETLHWNYGIRAVCADAAIFLALLLAAKLWQQWLGVQVAAVKNPTGPIGKPFEGVFEHVFEPGTSAAAPVAWLTPGDGILSLLLAACAAWGWGWSFFGVLLLSLLALASHHLYHKKIVVEPPPSLREEATSAGERGKVLAMLDAGKITAAESAELLNALAGSGSATPAPAERGANMPLGRQLLLAGGALVLVGFFLPWFSFSPGQEMQNLMGQMGGMGLMPNGQQFRQQVEQMTPPTVQVSGGDIGHGLGWLVLVLGLGTAVLPYFLPSLAEELWRRIAFFTLGVGGIVLVYLLHDSIHLAGIGIVVVLVGYVAEAAGVLQTGRRTG